MSNIYDQLSVVPKSIPHVTVLSTAVNFHTPNLPPTRNCTFSILLRRYNLMAFSRPIAVGL